MCAQVEDILEEVRGLSEGEQDYVLSHMRELLEVVRSRRDSDIKEIAKRDILEFEGVGAEMWKSVDSDEYLRALRSEWDQDRNS